MGRVPYKEPGVGKQAGYAANGTLAFRAVAGFESMSAQVGRTGSPGN
jgi:hypothetical protein